MKTAKLLLLIVSTLIIVSGCLKEDSIPDYEDVEGMVTSNSISVEGLDIHIRHEQKPGGFVINQVEELDLNLQVQSGDEYVGNLYRYGGFEPFAVFYDGPLEPGTNRIVIPDSLLSNGVIGYEIRNDIGQTLASLLSVSRPDSLIPEMIPFTTTDASGSFILPEQYLPFREVFTQTNGSDFEITDSLEIIISDGVQILKSEKVRVLPDQSNFFEINLDQ